MNKVHTRKLITFNFTQFFFFFFHFSDHLRLPPSQLLLFTSITYRRRIFLLIITIIKNTHVDIYNYNKIHSSGVK